MAKLYEEGFTQNREISWLRYNERVLEEAVDKSVPLFERLNYISIFFSNLEEFFQVRVGSLISDDEDGDDKIDSRSGLNPAEQLKAIYEMMPVLFHKMDTVYREIDKELRANSVIRMDIDELTKEELVSAVSFLEEYKKDIKPVLIKSASDMPTIKSNRTYYLSRLKGDRENIYIICEKPAGIPSLHLLSDAQLPGQELKYIVTDDLIKRIIPLMYSPFENLETISLSITRNADVKADEDAETRLEKMKSIVEQRMISVPDKIVVDAELSEEMKYFLTDAFGLEEAQIFNVSRTSFSFVGELKDVLPQSYKDRLCFKAFTPFNQLKLKNRPILDCIKEEDILSAYPFDSMDPLLELLKEASESESVKEIRMTIYRLSSHPLIVDYLLNAVEKGKKVSLLIELRARNDEEKNIDWAEKLSSAGCKIYFGDEKYKVHSKLCQIVVEDNGEARYITQVSTGNYNEKTAKSYTDFSLITFDQRIGKDVDEFFNDVFHKKEGRYNHILTSPKTMHEGLIKLIRREASKGAKGRIVIKVNSVTDEKLIEELMEASCAGCRIKMIVRGICCLLPGVPYCTENIEVVSVVGRLLEHSRVYLFGEGKDEIMYISSADFMTRNMLHRVEVACPIYNKQLRERIKAILLLNLIDNVKGRVLKSDGQYAMKNISGKKTDSQDLLIKQSQLV